MSADGARQSWATQTWMTESLSSSPGSLSRSSSPWPSQLRFSSQASSEFGDYVSTTSSVPPSPTSVPLPPVSPNELATPEPVHPIIYFKAELEDILDCQRKLRNDTRYVKNRLHAVDHRFGPHLIKAAPVPQIAHPINTVERELENDAIILEARRRLLVHKIAELMNEEINQIKRANKDIGKSNLESGQKCEKIGQEDNAAGNLSGSEVEEGKNDKADEDCSGNAVELQEWQYGDEEGKDADLEEEEYVRKGTES